MTTAKNILDKVLATLTALLFAALTLTVIWQVFARQVLTKAPAWTGEAAQYLFVWTSMIAIAFVFGERGHMAVLFLAERFPRSVRHVIAVFVQLCVIAFAALVMMWGGWRSSLNAWHQNSIALPFNIGPMYTVMPVAGVFIIFYAIHHMLQDLRGEGPLTVVDPSVVAEEQFEREATVADMHEAETLLDGAGTEPTPAAEATPARAVLDEDAAPVEAPSSPDEIERPDRLDDEEGR